MPAKSQAQRAWVYANKGAAWAKAHDFDNPGKLPKRVKKKKPMKKPKRKLPKRGMRTITNRKTGKKKKTKY